MGLSFSLLAKPISWVLGTILALLGYIWADHKKEVKAIGKRLDEEHYSKEVIDLKLKPLEEAVQDNTESNKELISAVNALNVSIARINGFTKHRTDTERL